MITSPPLSFYLYPEDSPRFTLLAKELHAEFSRHPWRTEDPDEADFYIATYANERNYPEYGNLEAAGGGPDPASVYGLLDDLEYRDKGLHITFYHKAIDGNDLETVVYSAPHEEKSRVIMPPPAIRSFRFNEGRRKYLVSFKGRTSSGYGNHRGDILGKVKKYHDGKKVIVVDKQDDNYDYEDLMSESEMLLLIEGDQPWSYRLTEAVNAGGIPVVVLPYDGDRVFPFSQILDYSKCSFLIKHDELTSFFEETVPNLIEDPSRLVQMRSELKKINDKYFSSRREHVQGVLDTLKATHS